MDDDDAWKREAQLEAINSTQNFLLQMLFLRSFDQDSRGPEASFRRFAEAMHDRIRRGPMVDVPIDRKQAAVSDISEALLLQFVDELAGRLGASIPSQAHGSSA